MQVKCILSDRQIFAEIKSYIRVPMERPIRIELPTVFGMKTVNAYFFNTPVPTLVDCGENSDESWNALEEQLGLQGVQVTDIQRIIITHAHVDHIGMAQRIVEASGCKVWVSPLVAPWATDLVSMKAQRAEMIQNTFEAYVQGDPAFGTMLEAVKSLFSSTDSFWKAISPEALHIFEMSQKLELGGRHWDVIHVPGHCANQTCFYDPVQKELISADMILSITPTPVIEYDPSQPDNRSRGLVQLLDSYAMISGMDIEHCYPGHYSEIDDPTSIIDFQVKRIHQRINETLRFVENGTDSFFKLLNQLYPNRVSMPAANMLIGYLDVLQDQHKIIVKDGTISRCA